MTVNNGVASKFQCEVCKKEGTLYLDKETKAWKCEDCYFKKRINID